jgi:hypothetical protein
MSVNLVTLVDRYIWTPHPVLQYVPGKVLAVDKSSVKLEIYGTNEVNTFFSLLFNFFTFLEFRSSMFQWVS